MHIGQEKEKLVDGCGMNRWGRGLLIRKEWAGVKDAYFIKTTICSPNCIQLFHMWCFLFSFKKYGGGFWSKEHKFSLNTISFAIKSLAYVYFFGLFVGFNCNSCYLGKQNEQLLVSIVFNDIMVKDTQCAVPPDVFQPQIWFQFSKMESIISQDC